MIMGAWFWALLTLTRSDVKEAFRQRYHQGRPETWSAAEGPSQGPLAQMQRTSRRLKAPAIGLMAIGGIHTASLLSVAAFSRIGIWEMLILLVPMITGPLVIVGGYHMLQQRSYAMAVTAAMLALIPCSPASPFSIAVGIWALVVLTSPESRELFQAEKRP